jgi:hypothetical protein
MKFADWLGAVESKIGFEFDEDGSIYALRHYREGWTVDDFAFEVEETIYGDAKRPSYECI